MREAHASHFESLEQQAHAARLGMWVFLASEALLFAGLFVLYAAERVTEARVFEEGIAHSKRLLGSLNTLILLCSSFTAAMALRSLRDARRRASLAYLGSTLVLGIAFLVVKGLEYTEHFEEGVFPGSAAFDTLYFVMTGLHAIHVIAGLAILAYLGRGILRERITKTNAHALEVGAIYWHLVDTVWIILWPLFYLTPGSA